MPNEVAQVICSTLARRNRGRRRPSLPYIVSGSADCREGPTRRAGAAQNGVILGLMSSGLGDDGVAKRRAAVKRCLEERVGVVPHGFAAVGTRIVSLAPGGAGTTQQLFVVDGGRWREAFMVTSQDSSSMTTEEELLRERKRMMATGVTSFNTGGDAIIVPMPGSLAICRNAAVAPVPWSWSKLAPSGACMDCQLSPDARLLAFIRNNNIWVMQVDTGTETQLTFTSGSVSSGVAEFIMQEVIVLLESS